MLTILLLSNSKENFWFSCPWCLYHYLKNTTKKVKNIIYVIKWEIFSGRKIRLGIKLMQNKKNWQKCSLLIVQMNTKMEVLEEQRKETVFLRIVLSGLKESKMKERSRGKKCEKARKNKKRLCDRNSCKMQLLPQDHTSTETCKTPKIWCIERLATHTLGLQKSLNVSRW